VVLLNPLALMRYPPQLAERLGLSLDVGEEGSVAAPLQPLVDEGPEDDLQAHGELERSRCLPHNDPGLVKDVLRQIEEDFGHGLIGHVI
jgi:hypothetical protein